MQRLSDDPVATCTVCAEPVERVFHPVAVHFKGSGFYTTDYGRNRGGGGGDSAAGGDSKKDSKEAAEGASSKSDSAKSDSGKSDSAKSEKTEGT